MTEYTHNMTLRLFIKMFKKMFQRNLIEVQKTGKPLKWSFKLVPQQTYKTSFASCVKGSSITSNCNYFCSLHFIFLQTIYNVIAYSTHLARRWGQTTKIMRTWFKYQRHMIFLDFTKMKLCLRFNLPENLYGHRSREQRQYLNLL